MLNAQQGSAQYGSSRRHNDRTAGQHMPRPAQMLRARTDGRCLPNGCTDWPAGQPRNASNSTTQIIVVQLFHSQVGHLPLINVLRQVLAAQHCCACGHSIGGAGSGETGRGREQVRTQSARLVDPRMPAVVRSEPKGYCQNHSACCITLSISACCITLSISECVAAAAPPTCAHGVPQDTAHCDAEHVCRSCQACRG